MEARPVCPCGVHPRARFRGRAGAWAYKPYCGNCYKAGVARMNRPDEAMSRFERPIDLKDTGFRIDDNNQELIHPDGRTETPVPDWVRFPEYWFTPVGRTGILKVMVQAEEKGAA